MRVVAALGLHHHLCHVRRLLRRHLRVLARAAGVLGPERLAERAWLGVRDGIIIICV